MTTDIVSAMGSRQIFEKVKHDDKLAKPGDPMAELRGLPDLSWSFNQGTVLI